MYYDLITEWTDGTFKQGELADLQFKTADDAKEWLDNHAEENGKDYYADLVYVYANEDGDTVKVGFFVEKAGRPV